MLKGTELIIGHTYFSKTASGSIITFTPTAKTATDNVWVDGFLSRNIADIEFTEAMAQLIGVNEIKQGDKIFHRSSVRNNAWIWTNRPLHSKSFDYYMCGCGKIISNCGFSSKHKCKN